MAIITISRQLGSLGTEIAKMLQDDLNMNYLDKESLEEELVSKYGIPEEKVERYDEKKPAFWDIFSSDKDRYLHFMKTMVYEFAQKGSCVIIGRGGQVLFKDVPGVLHVRVVAPIEVRIERVKHKYNYNDRLAEQIIRHTDHDRTGFHKFFFHINYEDPGFYDLILNTKSFTAEAAVRLIKDALDSSEIEKQQSEADRKINDLCLGQEVITGISYKEQIPTHFLEVVVVNGMVTLRGSALTIEDIGRCEATACTVPGVKEVVNEIHCIPRLPAQSQQVGKRE